MSLYCEGCMTRDKHVDALEAELAEAKGSRDNVLTETYIASVETERDRLRELARQSHKVLTELFSCMHEDDEETALLLDALSAVLPEKEEPDICCCQCGFPHKKSAPCFDPPGKGYPLP